MKINTADHSFRRMIIRGLTASITTAILLIFGIAWIFAYALTRPVCGLPQKFVEFPTPEEYWLKTEDGIQIRMWYYPSQNGAAIITMSGMGGSLGENFPQALFLLRKGFGVIQVDSRACAHPRRAVTLGYKEAYDAIAALEFLMSRPEVSPDQIGAFGFSMGGASVIRAAALRTEITAVAAEGNYYNLGEQIAGVEAAPSLMQRLFVDLIAASYFIQTGVDPWKSSPIDDLTRIRPRPVLLIFGEFEAAGARASDQFSAAGEPKELWIVPGGNHGQNHLITPKYEEKVVEFFDQALSGK